MTKYITSVERIGIKKGLEQGMQQGMQQGLQQGKREGLWTAIQFALEYKFGETGAGWMQRICEIEDSNLLQAIVDKLKTAKSLDEIESLLPA